MTIAISVGTQFRFIAATGFSPADSATDYTIGTPTDVLWTPSGVAAAAGRQSSKFDFGANRAAAYECNAAIDFTGETLTTPGTIDFYFAPSTSSTAANGNVAGNSGVDGAAPDGALGSITLVEMVAQCDFIGSLDLHDGAVVQNGFVGVLVPTSRYGQLIVVNNCSAAFEADNVETHVVFTAIAQDNV